MAGDRLDEVAILRVKFARIEVAVRSMVVAMRRVRLVITVIRKRVATVSL